MRGNLESCGPAAEGWPVLFSYALGVIRNCVYRSCRRKLLILVPVVVQWLRDVALSYISLPNPAFPISSPSTPALENRLHRIAPFAAASYLPIK